MNLPAVVWFGNFYLYFEGIDLIKDLLYSFGL